MEDSKIIRQEKFSLPQFKHITIGDPSYFASLQRNPAQENLLKITLNTDVSFEVASLIVSEVQDTFMGETFNTVEALINLAPNEDVLKIYDDDLWLGEETLQERKLLGCDTACFMMSVDDRKETFYTQADGWIGEVLMCKEPYGMIISLGFGLNDDYDAIVETLKYLFAI